MDTQAFFKSLSNSTPPAFAHPALLSLWYDHLEKWDEAHAAVQHETDLLSAATHAYLHRKEGDDWNARYWYKQAMRKPFIGSLKNEWESLVTELLAAQKQPLSSRVVL